jgi:D-methionine transport system ATP-binding protein
MIELEGVSKTFLEGTDGEVLAVKPTDLTVLKGRIQGVLGFSGAGKSTLLRLVNLLEQPTAGVVRVDGQALTSMSDGELRRARRSIGMIFQSFNLLSNRTCLANVEFALEFANRTKRQRRQRAMECLEIVGLTDKARAYPAQLSGGQRQRVGVARALANDPNVLLCDEATSSLDPHTTLSILRFLKQINRELEMTILVVTHEINVATYLCDDLAIMDNGNIVERLDLNDPEVEPRSPLGRFLFDTMEGWTDETELPDKEER